MNAKTADYIREYATACDWFYYMQDQHDAAHAAYMDGRMSKQELEAARDGAAIASNLVEPAAALPLNSAETKELNRSCHRFHAARLALDEALRALKSSLSAYEEDR